MDDMRSPDKLGQSFADTIRALSRGEVREMSKKVYSPTKVLFWEEKRYNPAMEFGHISHEYDAQIKEGEKHWSRQGKKFSGEPRFPSHRKQPGDGILETGFFRPAEIPQFNERAVIYFEKEHKPLKATKAPKANFKRVPKVQDRSITPLTYRIEDPWKSFVEPGVRPTSSFASPYKDDIRKYNTSTYYERACSPVGREEKRRPTTRHLPRVPLSLSTISSNESPDKNSASIARSSSSDKITHPTSTWGGYLDRHHVQKKIDIRKQTSIPGFTFKSQLPEGKEDFGLKYRRVRNSCGYPLIVPVSSKEKPLDVAPAGSQVESNWGVHDDNLIDKSLRVEPQKSFELLQSSLTDSINTDSRTLESLSPVLFTPIARRLPRKKSPDSLPTSRNFSSISPHMFAHIAQTTEPDANHFKVPLFQSESNFEKLRKHRLLREDLVKRTMDVIKSSIRYRTNALPVKLSDVISIVDSAIKKSNDNQLQGIADNSVSIEKAIIDGVGDMYGGEQCNSVLLLSSY